MAESDDIRLSELLFVAELRDPKTRTYPTLKLDPRRSPAMKTSADNSTMMDIVEIGIIDNITLIGELIAKSSFLLISFLLMTLGSLLSSESEIPWDAEGGKT